MVKLDCLKNKFLCFIIMFLAVLVSLQAEDGVYENRIVFGQSTALEGFSAELGQGLRAGVLAAFNEVNQQGGVNGKKLDLESINDGYDAVMAVAATKKLIFDDKVFGLIGAYGTPTSLAILPILTDVGAPYIGPYSGAAFLRDEKYTNVFNVRASYSEEIESLISYAVDKQGLKKIAVFYQNDGYGYDGLKSAKDALKKRGLEPIAIAAYQRNSLDVKGAFQILKKNNPEAILLVSTSKMTNVFIERAQEVELNSEFLIISFAAPQNLSTTPITEKVAAIISQIVPLPEESSVPLVKKYQEAMRALDKNASFNFVSLEGYLSGRIAIAILQKIVGPVTRASFIAAAHNQEFFDIDGYQLTYKGTNQSSKVLFLTRIVAGQKWQVIEAVKK